VQIYLKANNMSQYVDVLAGYNFYTLFVAYNTNVCGIILTLNKGNQNKTRVLSRIIEKQRFNYRLKRGRRNNTLCVN